MNAEHQNRPTGYSYFVSEEQLAAFSLLTPLQRLAWLDEARRFTLATQTPVTVERRERLRRGDPITL
jgi:hypothetical protein